MESGGKPVCRYGAKCYRKNPKHLKEYCHQTEIKENEKETRSKTRAAVKKTGNYDRNGKGKKQGDNSDCRAQPKALQETEKVLQNEDLDYKGKKRLSSSTDNTDVKKAKKNKETKNASKEESSSGDSGSDSDDVKSNSWTYIKTTTEEKSSSTTDALQGATKEEIIKFYYLVDMPPDFYLFFKFCESINQSDPLTVLNPFGLNLVGPFDILAGNKVNVSEKDLMLCHWRYFFDPPECQTVVASDSGYHIGYWRDSPQELPVFLASNNPNIDCQFKIEGDNIFGAIHNYLTEFIKKCDPFTKTKAGKFQTSLKEWAEREKYSLDKSTQNIKKRQKKVNSKTFHGAGIVVPVEKKTEVGYRSLCETDDNIKKICKRIIDADDDEREASMEKLQPLITFSNIANDECDFGNSLELGIDLFCMGSPVFDSTVEHLLTTAYSLLNRPEFGKIITVHLKNRRKDKNLSVL